MPPQVKCDPTPPRPAPCTLVLFGATGDLTRRKLIPALYSLACQNLLPERFAIVAFARRPKTDEEFREDLRYAIREFGAPCQPPDPGGSQAEDWPSDPV